MPTTTVAILHPGEMGSAVAARLAARGQRCVWASQGRSAATAARAHGIVDCGTLAAALREADIALSVCPPHGAFELARAVAAVGFSGIYVDANAIAPATAREVGRIVTANAGARFVDGGIIGPPPEKAGTTRLYLSGADAAALAAAWNDEILGVIALDGEAGAASALKACYAGWNKGSIALLTAIRALARQEGVDAALIDEWELSQPGLARRSEAITTQAYKAWRWVAEMEEIAASLSAVGLPPGFHEAAAEVFARLEGFKETRRLDSIAPALAALGTAGPKRG
ncbi:MAG: NAD(P)-dependent oxidoreductase [Burkholderiales bacterium]|nr:NAD(P)-dependent oxidoreductase [Burkholderiales bacterium]